MHGTALIPKDFRSEMDPGFEEAAVWMRRQALHFSKQKLTEKRLVMIQDVLGMLRTFLCNGHSCYSSLGCQHDYFGLNQE